MNQRLLLIRAIFLGTVFLVGLVSTLSLRADAVSMAVHFIAPWEGFSAKPYQDSAGCWTIGYGELLTCREDADPSQWESITEEDAEEWMRSRVRDIIARIRFDMTRGFTVTTNLSDEKLAALASLVYNIGAGNFDDSELLRMLRTHEPIGEVMREWLSWDHVHGEVNRGLSRRRAAEIGLFYFGTSHFK